MTVAIGLMRVAGLVSTVILARLLNPSDFGLVALAMVLLSTSHLFTGLGMGSALIHSQQDISQIAYHAFVITLCAGLLYFGLVYTNIERLSALLGSVRVVPILQWLSPLILLNNLSIVPNALLRKELMFKQVSSIIFIAEVLYIFSAVACAIGGYGVWSLVYARLLSASARTLLIWGVCPGWAWITPTPWHWTEARALLSYGLQTFGSGLTSYIHSHWDDWLVGRTLGEAALGLYGKAYEFTNRTVTTITKQAIGSVFLASYAKLQDDRLRLKNTYLKSIYTVLLVMTPFAFSMFFLADPLVSIIFGEKWLLMVPTLQMFSLVILTRPISENSAPLFQAIGYPSYNTRAGLLLLAVMIPLALALLSRGIWGIALAVVISHFVGMAYNVYQVNTLLPGVARPVATAFFTNIAVGIAMMSSMALAQTIGANVFALGYLLADFLVPLAVGAITYLIAAVIVQRPLVTELGGLVLHRMQPMLQLFH